MTDYSKIRQKLSELGREEQALLASMMRPSKMVRGSLTWHQKRDETQGDEGLFPGLNRMVDGKSVGRRVRLAHREWLEPLLAAYRGYRHNMQRMKAIHKEMYALVDTLRYERMYDYEPTAPEHLVPVVPSAKGQGDTDAQK